MAKPQRINEEITKSEIRGIVNSMLNDFLKEKDFEKRVRDLTVDVMEKFYKLMYNRRNFWKGEIKNG